MALDFSEEFEQEALHKDVTFTEKLATRFELGLMNSETATIGRFLDTKLSADEEMLTAEQANELAPNLEKKFTEPISKGAAMAIKEHNDDFRRRQELLSLEPATTFDSVMGFGAELVGAALDPIGMATGFGAAKLGTGLMAKSIGKAFLEKTSGRVTTAAVSGALGNIVSEGAIIMPIDIAEQRDRDIMTSLGFAAAAGAILPGAMEALKGFSRAGVERLVEYQKNKIAAGKDPRLSEAELNTIRDGENASDLDKKTVTEEWASPDSNMHKDHMMDEEIAENLAEAKTYTKERLDEEMIDLDEVEVNEINTKYQEAEAKYAELMDNYINCRNG